MTRFIAAALLLFLAACAGTPAGLAVTAGRYVLGAVLDIATAEEDR